MNSWIVDESKNEEWILRNIEDVDIATLSEQVVVRNANVTDLFAMMKCEQIAWENQDQRASLVQMKLRILNFPEGNFIVTKGNDVYGIINFTGYEVDWNNPVFPSHKVLSGSGEASNHNSLANSMFAINVAAISDESFLPRGLTQVGTALSQAAIALAIKRGYQYIFGVGYMPLYFQYADKMTPEEYAVLKGDNGYLVDPVLAYYDKVGLKYVCMEQNLFADEGSLNYNPIVRWTNLYSLFETDTNGDIVINLPDLEFFQKTQFCEFSWADMKHILIKIFLQNKGKKVYLRNAKADMPNYMQRLIQMF